jgi:DNA (cytosine-5)-methyltransferase 1
MTSTQVPIIASERRYMTPIECKRLQNMQSLKHMPSSQTGVVRALGNAVNVNVAQLIAKKLIKN